MRIKGLVWVLALVLLVAVPSLNAQQFSWVGVSGGGGFLGVQMRDVTGDDVKKADLDAEKGVWVLEVSKESPAEKAGLNSGDVIIEFSGLPVLSATQFRRIVQETPPGRTVEMKVMREGKAVTLSVEVGKRESAPTMLSDAFEFAHPKELFEGEPREFRFRVEPGEGVPFPRALHAQAKSGLVLGVSAIPLTEQMAEFLKVKEEGALVLEVGAGSAAAKAGIKAGDVIVELNGTKVSDPVSIREGLKAGSNEIQFYREGQSQKVTVEIAEAESGRKVIRGEKM